MRVSCKRIVNSHVVCRRMPPVPETVTAINLELKPQLDYLTSLLYSQISPPLSLSTPPPPLSPRAS